jgi:PadR family transcriptional regulator PadR
LAGSLHWVRVSADGGSARAHADHGHLAVHAANFTLEEFFVLGALKEREMYGLEIVRSLSTHSAHGFSAGTGTVCPLLKTLVKEGALRSRRGSGFPRTYYSLTEQGRERFLAIAKSWAGLNEAVQSVAADIGPPGSV